MYIYKITVIPLNQCYIGLDTNPSYKLSRWKTHQRSSASTPKTKLHKAIAKFGIANCIVEVIEDNFTSIGALALAEISYIKQFNSFKNGLNSTPGGDGLGVHDLCSLSNREIDEIKKSLGDNLRDYNKNVKWAGTTKDQRKERTKHLHTEEIYQKKSATLKNFYKANPDERDKKKVGIMKWQEENRELLKKNNQKNSLLGAAKVSKKLTVEFPDGSMLNYPSKSEFQRQTGLWAKTILEKTLKGLNHYGYRAWEQ